MNKTIQEAVADKIFEKGQSVAGIVVDKLAEIEIAKRVDMITKAIQKQDILEKDFKKINKNDNITYVDGKEVQSMTKNRFEDIKKMKEKMESLAKAVEAALSQNTPDAYIKLSETLKKLDNVGGNKAEESNEG